MILQKVNSTLIIKTALNFKIPCTDKAKENLILKIVKTIHSNSHMKSKAFKKLWAKIFGKDCIKIGKKDVPKCSMHTAFIFYGFFMEVFFLRPFFRNFSLQN